MNEKLERLKNKVRPHKTKIVLALGFTAGVVTASQLPKKETPEPDLHLVSKKSETSALVEKGGYLLFKNPSRFDIYVHQIED